MRDTSELAKVVFPPDFVTACLEVPWVDFKGTRYRVGMCVAVKFDDFCGLPFFGDIDRIYCNGSENVCLLYHALYTVGLEENLHAYKVISTGHSKCIVMENLLSSRPAICVRMPDNNVYVSLRYAV